ncbi:MAG TPA: DUF2313 domain-containing protein [Clostridiales bacterium]|nr:DUF2313 domain-containing protein [Clostridiales bacterium]
MELMELLPPQCYNGEEHMEELQAALGRQVEEARKARDDLFLQGRPSTATWGLANYEREYGIIPDPAKPLKQRLALWRAKRRGHGTTTVEVIRGMAQSAFGGEAMVTERPGQYLVEIKTIGTSLANREDFQTAVSEIIPAHLAVKYTYGLRHQSMGPTLTAVCAMRATVIHNHKGE